MFVSIITPTYNRRASLGRLLRALTRATYAASSFEVIVVDDGSDDDTAEFLRTAYFDYSLRIMQQEHAGPSAARNLGVANARGSLILFLDDDVEPIPELIELHV